MLHGRKADSREGFRVQALESDCLSLKSDSASYSVTLQFPCFHFLIYKVRELVVWASQDQCVKCTEQGLHVANVQQMLTFLIPNIHLVVWNSPAY